MAKRDMGTRTMTNSEIPGSDVRSTFVSKPRMLQNRPTSAARRRASILATPSWS